MLHFHMTCSSFEKWFDMLGVNFCRAPATAVGVYKDFYAFAWLRSKIWRVVCTTVELFDKIGCGGNARRWDRKGEGMQRSGLGGTLSIGYSQNEIE
jgi:hypothetical protein